MRTEQDVLRQLQEWAEKRENVRAVMLTSFRANPHRTLYVLSVYDVEVFVQDTAPFVRDNSWVNEFGSIIVRRPSSPRPISDVVPVTERLFLQTISHLSYPPS